jgi:hypothetical protein
MLISIKSKVFPVRIKISGNINQIQYTWRVEPLLKYVNTFNLHEFLVALKNFMLWSATSNIECTYQAPFAYRMAINLLS